MGAALLLTDREWALQCVDTFPRSWQARLLDRWRRDHRSERRAGNLRLLASVRTLGDSARGGIRPDASDTEICAQADTTARDFARRLATVGRTAQIKAQDAQRIAHLPGAGYSDERAGAVAVRLQAFYARALLAARGLLDLWPGKKKDSDRRPALKRLCCARWWRRVYRKLHARTVEACAIDIGLVRRTAGLYASDDSVKRRAAQNARNLAALQSVSAINEHAQEFTLADLAAKGTANKAIRRVELLTRIAGFEHIAKACGHDAAMVTVSCPSRFHRTTTRADGRVVDNPRWDGSSPADAQRYLSRQWARCRAAAARGDKKTGREPMQWYGFRIAEPQQDGTPHWHSILFLPAGRRDALLDLMRRYFLLNDSPDERGAAAHRIDIEPIDWQRGSAVGYVIKYVSKNIDGHGVGLDLYGNDAITTSARVEAWAATWRIRQFQQIGGAPVGVWRELRRIHPDQLQREGAPQALREALVAVNVAKTEPGVAAIAWRRYTELQGGTACKRDALAVKLHKEATGEIGRYGEVMAARALGVVAAGVEFFRNHIHVLQPGFPAFSRPSAWTVASERAEWVIGRGIASVRAAAGRVFPRSGAAASTRIHVNNCTQRDPARVSEFAPTVRTLPKLGRFVRRNPPPGTPPGTTSPQREESPCPVSH